MKGEDEQKRCAAATGKTIKTVLYDGWCTFTIVFTDGTGIRVEASEWITVYDPHPKDAKGVLDR